LRCERHDATEVVLARQGQLARRELRADDDGGGVHERTPSTTAVRDSTTSEVGAPSRPSRSDPGLDAVLRGRHPRRLTGAVRAAEEAPVDLGAVADHLAPAVVADGRHLVDGALEAVEGVVCARGDDLEGLVVVVPADLAASHVV